ncbi:MAG: hypothetical protein ACLGIR_10385 [Actinomycetes bacterium]
MTRAAPRRIAVAVLLAAAAVTGCADPSTEPAVEETTAAADELRPPDPRLETLTEELQDLRATVTTARDLLAAAGAEGDPAPAREAVAALTADEDLRAGAEAPVAPLFPGPEISRAETIDYGDVLTSTLTAARDAGQVDTVAQLLGDRVAGDLGAWQRDPAGRLAAVDAAARTRGVEQAEAAVLELPGEGTRALAYALLAARATSPDDVTAFAERAVVHLDLILRDLPDAEDVTGADAPDDAVEPTTEESE